MDYPTKPTPSPITAHKLSNAAVSSYVCSENGNKPHKHQWHTFNTAACTTCHYHWAHLFIQTTARAKCFDALRVRWLFQSTRMFSPLPDCPGVCSVSPSEMWPKPASWMLLLLENDRSKYQSSVPSVSLTFLSCWQISNPLKLNMLILMVCTRVIPRYKSEGRWFDPRWCHGILHWHKSSWSHYGPGVN
jgi:hypothetical protein